jgi:hypothetical protein
MKNKYQIGDLVKAFLFSKWRVAAVVEIKECEFFNTEYSLLVCGIPNEIHKYYEDDTWGKL